MRLPVLALCAALALSPLSACETLPTGGVASATLTDEKALYAAESAFRGATLMAEAAVDSGSLTGERARQVADALQTAHTALLIARSAHSAGNASLASTEALIAIADAYKIIKESE